MSERTQFPTKNRRKSKPLINHKIGITINNYILYCVTVRNNRGDITMTNILEIGSGNTPQSKHLREATLRH